MLLNGFTSPPEWGVIVSLKNLIAEKFPFQQNPVYRHVSAAQAEI